MGRVPVVRMTSVTYGKLKAYLTRINFYHKGMQCLNIIKAETDF